MAALSADARCSTVGSVSTSKAKASAADTYYKGSIVYFDVAGGTDAVGTAQLTIAAGDRVAGVSPKKQVVAAGDYVEIITAGKVVLPTGSGVTAVDGGDLLVNDGATASDNPADMKAAGDITLAANDAAIGRIISSDGTDMEIELGPGITGMLASSTDGAWG